MPIMDTLAMEILTNLAKHHTDNERMTTMSTLPNITRADIAS